MNLFITILFFLSLYMIFYIYLGYPLFIFLISIFRNKNVKRSTIEPYVTIIISAYNEEEIIEGTLKNKLKLDYPKEKLEILVISDGSTDHTDEIVNKFQESGIKLIRQEKRAGKTAALNIAVKQASGEILVFSDANSTYARDALKKLVRNFSDIEVGYVTGTMIYTKHEENSIGDGCTTYMKYENFLHKIETKVGSIVGVDGGIDAIRKELYQPMNPDQLPDFVLPLRIVDNGFRVVYEPDAILKEAALQKNLDEYRMRIRVALRAFWALNDMLHMLSFRKYGFFAIQLWSHKVLRYLCFIFIICVLVSNLLLLSQGAFYIIFLILQSIVYIGSIVSFLASKKGFNIKVLSLSNYFLLLNLASAHAFLKFLMGQKQVLWTPRKG